MKKFSVTIDLPEGSAWAQGQEDAIGDREGSTLYLDVYTYRAPRKNWP